MNRQNIIVLTQVVDMNEVILYGKGFQECYGNLKKACDVHGWTYNTLVKKKMPFVVGSWLVHRVPFN